MEGRTMKRLLAPLLLLVLPLAAWAQPGPSGAPASTPAPAPAAASALTPAQRQEVVQVVRDALRADPTILRDALVALQADDMRQQERTAQGAIAARRAALVADPTDPAAGDPRGVSVVYFYDTRCPYCRRMHPVLADLLRAEPHGVRVVYKDLPILGPASTLEARALLAALRQGGYAGGYAKMQDSIMRGGGQPTRESLRAEATRLGLDGDRLLRDMDDPAVQAHLDATLALARELQIQGTPAIVVGDKMLPGAVELPALRQAVAEARKG